MKSKYSLGAVSLIVSLILLIPAAGAGAAALATTPAIDPPPADMFQLPWEQGAAWVAIDGLDNGTNRPLNSSHHFALGGAVDFAPHNHMLLGENTSNAWVVAAAAGTVIETSSCHLKIDHGNGWVTEYQFIGNLQVKSGDHVERNQHLAVVADGIRLKFCPPIGDILDQPHLHFMLRPNIRNAAFSGWVIGYNPLFNATTFTKGDQSFSLFKPILNVPGSGTPGPTPTPGPTSTPDSGEPSVLTVADPPSFNVGANSAVTVNLNHIPAGGYTSAEFTCTYDTGLVAASNIAAASLFGADAAVAINDPQNGSFIVAIAGTNGNKATGGGAAFTFNVNGLHAGQTTISCTARVSTGDSTLTTIPSTPASLGILAVLTSTPLPGTATPTPNQGPTVTATATPIVSPTPTGLPAGSGAAAGTISAVKPIGVNLYNTDHSLALSVAANPDGSFSLVAPAGTYTVVATAAGFLGVQGTLTLTDGVAGTLPNVSLAAGDIDNNNVIDQFDALTLGMNYNAAVPAAADLNADGIINVLDLELLAGNYRKTGPLPWQ